MINTVHNGDCLELMKLIPDGSVDMILCDLPYGTTACKWDVIIPFEPLWLQYKRVIKSNGAIVLTASQPFTSALVMSNPKMFRHTWVWNKRFAASFANCNRAPMKIHEDVLVFGLNGVTYTPIKTIRKEPIKLGGKKFSITAPLTSPRPDKKTYYDKFPESILLFNARDEERGLHPTQKPVALFEYLIKTYTNEGETVLDNCAGSGTTAIACLNTNRNYILMEKEEKYFAMINERIVKYKATPKQLSIAV